MAGPAWNDEVASARADANLVLLGVQIVAESYAVRALPHADLVCAWHRSMLEGVDIPDDAYRGAFRGDAHPALHNYEANVGGLSVTPAADVATAVSDLIAELQTRVQELDELDVDERLDEESAEFVEAALETAAWLHGEWVRIHPFANGNGRTARMWVLWLCARYALPQLLALRPRPDMGYGACAYLSMTGDHSLFGQYLLSRYNAAH
jgi:hypothetical protein